MDPGHFGNGGFQALVCSLSVGLVPQGEGFVHSGARLSCIAVIGQQLEEAVVQHLITGKTLVGFMGPQVEPAEKGNFLSLSIHGAAMKGVAVLCHEDLNVEILTQGVHQGNVQKAVGEIQFMAHHLVFLPVEEEIHGRGGVRSGVFVV